jgi:hypothetical protein
VTTPSPTPPGLAAVQRLTDPERRAERAAELLERIEKDWSASVMAVRDDACRELLEQGRSAAEVGRLIKRTRAAVAKRFPAAR